MKTNIFSLLLFVSVVTLKAQQASSNLSSTKGFPAIIPLEKPQDRPLSASMERLYDRWSPHEDRDNELYSNFKFTPLPNLGKSQHVSRRDPSKVIKVNGLYYVYYTCRKTASEPVGVEGATDVIPAYDWDLADIWYATSTDGFVWEEKGIAIGRNPIKGGYGDRSATTTDILMVNNKYYLYYQAFTGMMGNVDPADVTVAWADSPEGPWTKLGRPVVARGAKGEWDDAAIHDPNLLVFKGQIYLYYKGQNFQMRTPNAIKRAQGVAVANDPLGPFVKSMYNPICNSGHETNYFPFKDGIAATVSIDGPEKNTVQFSKDGIHFEVASHIQMVPVSPGPFIPDAFNSNGDAKGFTWGLCHINAQGGGGSNYCFLARFDCDLSTQVDVKAFKRNNIRFDEHTYFQKVLRLDGALKKQATAVSKRISSETSSAKLTN
ncbi:MAG: glycoside hydrolase family 117 protein [Flavicella sp.]